MSFPTVTRKATLKIINAANKAGILLDQHVPAVFLEADKAGSNQPGQGSGQMQNPSPLNDSIALLEAGSSTNLSEKERYFIEALITAHLKELKQAFNVNTVKEKTKANWRGRLKFILLAIAGTIFFGCEGFDGVAALMGVFNLPGVVSFIAGTVFSILSIGVFYAFDLVEISNNLGVNLKSAPKMIDYYLNELESITALRIKINAEFSKMPVAELDDYIRFVAALKQRRHDILKNSDRLKEALNHKGLKAAKLITAAVTGIIFFSSGFFAGQTVALMLGGLAVSGLVPTFWPIILVGIVVGLAAAAVYWFVERPGIENLIGRIIGLDKEKIEKLTNTEDINKESNQMDALLTNLESRKKDLQDIAQKTNDYEQKKTAYDTLTKKHEAIQEENQTLHREAGVVEGLVAGMSSALKEQQEISSSLLQKLSKAEARAALLESQLAEANKDLAAALSQNSNWGKESEITVSPGSVPRSDSPRFFAPASSYKLYATTSNPKSTVDSHSSGSYHS